MKSGAFDRAVSITLAVAAIAIAGVLVHREFFQDPGSAAARPEMEPEYIEDWGNRVDEQALYRLGRADALVQILVFFDLECPFCSRYHDSVLVPLLKEAPEDVSVSFVQFPLTMHRFAEPAGKALDCAADQGGLLPYMEVVFAQQDSLGLKEWASFAREAGMKDLGRFQSCVSVPELQDRVTRGRELALEFGIGGTPTVVVNGWDLPSPPSRERLDEMIARLRRGEPPLDAG